MKMRTKMLVGLLAVAGVAVAWAGRIIEFNPSSAVVTNRVVRDTGQGQDTLQWQGRSNVLINPEVPTNGTWLDWKVAFSGGESNVVEMSAQEKSAIASAEAAAALQAKKDFIRDLYVRQQQAEEMAHRAAIESLAEAVIDQLLPVINQLRTQPLQSSPAINDATAKLALKNAFLGFYTNKVNAISQ